MSSTELPGWEAATSDANSHALLVEIRDALREFIESIQQQLQDLDEKIDTKADGGTRLLTLAASAVTIDGVPSEMSGELLVTL